MAITKLELRVTIKTLATKGVAHRAIARQLGLSEGTVRYHLRRMASGATDGRGRQRRQAASHREAIAYWLESRREGPVNLAALHDWLRAEHGYDGSLRSVQRYVGEAFPRPAVRARRRFETPPGAQAQVDWAQFPRIVVGGEHRTLHAFRMVLSHSRFDAVVWMPGEDQLCWLEGHNGSFRRLGGVPASLRVDNAKTAIVRGAGPWGEVNATYRRYASVVRFHIDPCLPYSPEHKGKVERAVRTQRWLQPPDGRAWDSVEELQAWSDMACERSARSRVCPATGSSVWEAWHEERPFLQPVPVLPQPFDLVATRRVGRDCLVAFEGRQYSVPFRLLGQTVEVRGAAGRIQVLTDCEVVAEHPRHTTSRLIIDQRHYDGPATERVLPPTPLGRMGRRLQELTMMPVEHRPIDLYAALAEVAR